jgi:hypothetical protein
MAVRVRLRTLLVAIAFVALLLTVGLLSLENARLHRLVRDNRRVAELERYRADVSLAHALWQSQMAAKTASNGK